ncbi:hypothetical protein Dxin01_03319 [Deinococcus xinjiangensis]|uniref:Metallo-beta-lactamase domain-containing protein n=1 Tax=Deinococcus xinjiangensis TaxID=457454 RepID=A0ABP9VG45_9DEIO
MTAVQVVPLTAGECLNIKALTERGAAWRVGHYPAGFALLLHPTFGPVLFDTGYGLAVVRAMRRWPALLYGLVTPVRLDPRDTALAQLERMGFTAQDIGHVILSHLHADHVGGLLDFPHSRLVLDERAYAPMKPLHGLRAVRKAYLPELLPSDFGARMQPLTFRPAPPELAPFFEYADVFGDGSVLALPVAGHAAGMIALLVRVQAGAELAGDGRGWVLLAADAAWSVRGLRLGLPVHPLARVAFFDVQAEGRSAEQLRAWLARHPHTPVIVSHDAPELSRV